MKKATMGWAADLLLGALLAMAAIMTASHGLSDENRACYEKALEMQPYMDTLGFEGYALCEYPVAVYQGGREYVLYQTEVTEREPVLGVLAGTAAPVEDHYEIFVPDVKDSALLSGIITDGKEKRETMQVSIIWHESFHAWQQTYHGENVRVLAGELDFEAAGDALAALDASPAYRAWLCREAEILMQALAAGSDHECRALAAEWLAHDRSMDSPGLTDKDRQLIDYYELMEGSAYYVEAKVYLALAGETAYNESYGTEAFSYANGTSKYYETGRLKLMLLDKLAPGWQTEFDCRVSVSELLRQIAE